MKITKKMRFLLIALSVVMVLSLFACGDTPEETTTKAPETTEQKPTEPTETTEKTEKTEPTETTETPVVDTTDSDSETTEATEGSTESGSETTETGSETASATETTEAPACEHAETEVNDECDLICKACGEIVGEKQHTPLAPDPKLNCNVICDVCGEVLEEAQHKEGEPDAEDACNVYCANGCGLKMAENKHAEGVVDTEDHCIVKCPTCKTPMGESQHTVAAYTAYVANPDGDEAMISGTCSECGDTVTKLASMLFSIEGIYGDNGEDVMVFNGAAVGTTIMGTSFLEFKEGHQFYPANGYAPIPSASATGFGNLMGVSGWAGYLGSGLSDTAAYKIVDAEGNVLVDWTAVADKVPVLGGVTYKVEGDGGAAMDAVLGSSYADASATHIKFNHIINIMDHYSVIQGKNVKVIFAFVTAQGVDGDVYIPYVSLDTAIPACNHVAGEPDKADNCNVKCTVCGAIIEEGKHTMGEWAIDLTAPQNDVAACECGHKEYRPATTTLKGLTLYNPDMLLACSSNGGYKGSVVTDEKTGLKYFRAVSGKDATEGNITINDYEKNGNTPITNVGNIAFLIVRKNVGEATIQLMTNAPSVKTGVTTGRIEPQVGIALGEDFQIIFFNVSSKIENGELGWLRIDLINGSKSKVDVDAVDVAAFGFADTEADAYAYFGLYVNAYGLKCNHIPDKTWVTTENEGEIAMTCTVCGDICNAMQCAHADLSKLSNITAKETPADNAYYTADCAICGGEQVDVPSLNQEQYKVFTAAELNNIALIQAAYGLESNAGFSRYSAELIVGDEAVNGMPYVRFTSKSTAEGGVFLNDGTAALLGVHDYVAVLYRKTGSAGNFEFLCNKAGTINHSGHSAKPSAALVADGTWQMAIIYANGIASGKTEGYGWTRLDIFNGTIAAGDVVDIAYVGFFSSEAAAHQYFKGYLGLVDCYHAFDGNYVTTGKVDEMQAKCTICEEDVVLACTHPNKTVTATDDPHNFDLTCNICGKAETTTKVNDQNLAMFDAKDVYDRAKADGGANYSVTEMTEGDLSFVRFQTLADKAKSAEWYFWVVNSADPDFTGVSDYFMIVYRTSAGYPVSIDTFISNNDALDGTHCKNRSLIASGEWQVVVFDYSACAGYDDTKNVVSRFRLDIFNNSAAAAKGEYIDIAYMGFFASQDQAYENYFKAVDKYGFESANWYGRFDKISLDGGETNVRDNASIVTKADKENGTWVANLSGQTLDMVTSLQIQGWIVTPGGAASISYRIVKADGTKSELKLLLKPGNINSSNGIAGATTGYAYGDGRYQGCGYQSTTAKFDLSGYEEQVVTVEVYVVTNNGQMGNIINFTNVTVPGIAAVE